MPYVWNNFFAAYLLNFSFIHNNNQKKKSDANKKWKRIIFF